MSFLNEYKHLDNLCKSFDAYPNGITSYLGKMDKATRISKRCEGWDSDYKKLKAYRHIRNRLSHDNDVYEKDLCGQGDEKWLKSFSARISKGEDPLSIYNQANRKAVKNKESRRKTAETRSKSNIPWAFLTFITLAVIAFLAWLVYDR